MPQCKYCNPGRQANHKLTDEQVLEIRRMYIPLPSGADPKAYPDRVMYRDLSKEFGVSKNTIGKIINYETYEWVL